MRKHLVPSLVLGLAILIFAPLSGGQVDTTAVIAAWNLKGFEPIDDARIARLARALADLDAEVVALAEVNPDDVLDKLILELGKLGACYQRKILDQTARQNLAILYKTGVWVSNVQLVEGSDDGNAALRKALAADVRVGQFDFKIVALHLKAGRTTNNRQQRTRQATVLAGFVSVATAGAEKDVLVLGDYNMIPVEDAENFAAMNPTGFLRFVSSEDLAGQFSHVGGSLLDGYAISREHTREYIEGSLVIVPFHRVLQVSLQGYEGLYSDHLPLVARFRITVDDD